MSGHNRVRAQSCLGTIVSGHNRVWTQSCMGTVVSGHSRVGPVVWAQSCMGTNVVEPTIIAQLSLCLYFCGSVAAVKVGTSAVPSAHAQTPVMLWQVEFVLS